MAKDGYGWKKWSYGEGEHKIRDGRGILHQLDFGNYLKQGLSDIHLAITDLDFLIHADNNLIALETKVANDGVGVFEVSIPQYRILKILDEVIDRVYYVFYKYDMSKIWVIELDDLLKEGTKDLDHRNKPVILIGKIKCTEMSDKEFISFIKSMIA